MKRLLVIALLVVGCSAVGPTPEPIQTPAYDLARVKATWTAECVDPVYVDADFCAQVQLNAMTGDGTILRVPTTLDAGETDRAKTICNLFTFASFDANGVALGYQIVGILDKDGGNAAACTIDQ